MGILPLTGIELRFLSHLADRVFTVDTVIGLEGFAVHSDHWWNQGAKQTGASLLKHCGRGHLNCLNARYRGFF